MPFSGSFGVALSVLAFERRIKPVERSMIEPQLFDDDCDPVEDASRVSLASGADSMVKRLPSSTPVRWAILLFCCVGMFGPNYVYDIPAALNDALSADLNLSSFQFNLFYSFYSFPNCIIPLFGGILVDRLGYSLCLLLFSILVMAGQSVFAVGASLHSYSVCLAGRFVFGLGGESLTVATSVVLAQWFKKKEVAFAMSIALTISRLGSVANNNLSAYAYRSTSLQQAVWLGTFFTLLSLVSVMMMIAIDNRAKKLFHFEGESDVAPAETAHLSDISHFPLVFWLLTGSCVSVYATVLPFNNIASTLLEHRNLLSIGDADLLMSVPYTISSISSPFLGATIDQVGLRGLLLCVSAAALCVSHALFALTNINPIVPLVILGCAYALYSSAVWPSLALVTDDRHLGSAFGTTTAVQNVGLSVVPIVVGKLHDVYGTYTVSELFLSGLAAFGVLLGILINIVDWTQYDGRLNKKEVCADPDSLLNDPYNLLEDERTETVC